MIDEDKARIAAALIGKTIKSCEIYSYMSWVCIGTIEFEDGTTLSLSGNADDAHIDSIELPGNECVELDFAYEEKS